METVPVTIRTLRLYFIVVGSVTKKDFWTLLLLSAHSKSVTQTRLSCVAVSLIHVARRADCLSPTLYIIVNFINKPYKEKLALSVKILTQLEAKPGNRRVKRQEMSLKGSSVVVNLLFANNIKITT
jgi:hypothetical protein